MSVREYSVLYCTQEYSPSLTHVFCSAISISCLYTGEKEKKKHTVICDRIDVTAMISIVRLNIMTKKSF